MDSGIVRVLDALPHAVVAADSAGLIVYANPALHALLGWEPEQLVGRPVTLLTPPRLRGIHLTAFERYMQTGIPSVLGQPLAVSACTPTGRERDVTLTLAPLDVGGERAVLGTLLPRAKVESRAGDRDDLRFQLDFTNAIMASLGDGVYALDRQGRVTYMNQAAERMLGWRESELLGKDMHDTIHYRREDGVLVPAADCPLMEVMRSGITYHSESDVFIRRNGAMFPVAYTSAPIVTDGEIVGAALSFRDRTAERQLEREKDLFLSAVAHDLRSPLTSIKGFTQLLMRRAQRGMDLSPSQVIPHLERVDSTTDRVTGLVDELLDITRVRMGRALDLTFRRADLIPLVSDVVEMLRPGARRQILVRCDVDAIWGEWDAGRLQRMVTNLLSNAIKYSPEGSVVRVTLACEPEFATIDVANDGIGIPAADLPYIFDQFARGRNVQGHLPGAGIGLASVRHIVEYHGGSIDVASDEGAGATFTVRLPLHPPPVQRPTLLERSAERES